MSSYDYPIYNDVQYTCMKLVGFPGSKRETAINCLGRLHLRKHVSLLWLCPEITSSTVFHFICNWATTIGHVNFIHTFTHWNQGLLEQILQSRGMRFRLSSGGRDKDKLHLSLTASWFLQPLEQVLSSVFRKHYFDKVNFPLFWVIFLLLKSW